MDPTEYEPEPIIEKGKDTGRPWFKVLIVVIVIGVTIGYVASVSYTKYPYTVNVGGTITSPDGSRATIVGFVECNAWTYTNSCPDPGQIPSYDCEAPPQMNLTQYCEEFVFDNTPGHYHVTLRNGETYTMSAYMQFSNTTFDKVCFLSVRLTPDTSSRNVTQNFSC
ncbi:MAG TPA: hypothetical protein VLY65_00960 [Nitrososphaerales archaeon]|nr:hypothetical protein [Nitrososphaerales archaeon]